MRTSSANAVSSPWMSMTLASLLTLRTSIVTCAWGISSLLFRLISPTPWYSPRRDWREPCSPSPPCAALLTRPPPHRGRSSRPGRRPCSPRGGRCCRSRRNARRARRPTGPPRLVREGAREGRGAGDVEDLGVMLGEPVGREVALRGPGPGEEADGRGEARGRGVLHPPDVEEED